MSNLSLEEMIKSIGYKVEAHGLSTEDLVVLSEFTKSVADPVVKRILEFIVKSNVLVPYTQDVTKMNRKE